MLIPRLPSNGEIRQSAHAETLAHSIILFPEANSVHAGGLSNDRGVQQRQRIRAECRPCQEPNLLAAMNHQQLHNRIPCQWHAGRFLSNPYDDGLEGRDRVY